jgi:two-component system osmolarity sensor histidine kinase EnvZ
LGTDSLIAWEVNHDPAFWVSFTSNGRAYWLAFERHKIGEITRLHWASWILAAALLSMIGAWVSTSFLNRPLNRLARFAKCLAKGQTPVPLPENGAHEIKLVNKSFNHMFQALRDTESDRELMLAGLSHDLRTPLTRMRLEIEMSTMPAITRTLIDNDLEQVDRSINKLIEYARASSYCSQNTSEHCTPVIDISQELTRLVTLEAEQCRDQDASLQAEISSNLHARIDPLNLQRILSNLLENAKRYGRNASGVAEIFIRLHRQDQKLLLEISDTGPGITPLDIEILMRPFYRGNHARTDCVGTGLGLAIAERLVKQAHGTISLLSRPENIGLHVLIWIPSM